MYQTVLDLLLRDLQKHGKPSLEEVQRGIYTGRRNKRRKQYCPLRCHAIAAWTPRLKTSAPIGISSAGVLGHASDPFAIVLTRASCTRARVNKAKISIGKHDPTAFLEESTGMLSFDRLGEADVGITLAVVLCFSSLPFHEATEHGCWLPGNCISPTASKVCIATGTFDGKVFQVSCCSLILIRSSARERSGKTVVVQPGSRKAARKSSVGD